MENLKQLTKELYEEIVLLKEENKRPSTTYKAKSKEALDLLVKEALLLSNKGEDADLKNDEDFRQGIYRVLEQINPIVPYKKIDDYKGLKGISYIMGPMKGILSSELQLGRHFYRIYEKIEEVKETLEEIVAIEIEDADYQHNESATGSSNILTVYTIYGIPKPEHYDELGRMTELGNKTLNY